MLPPAMAHVGQRDQLFVRVAVVWDGGKDFWRDLVDGDESVLDGPGNKKYLGHTLLQCIDLKMEARVNHRAAQDIVSRFPLPRSGSKSSRFCRTSVSAILRDR